VDQAITMMKLIIHYTSLNLKKNQLKNHLLIEMTIENLH